MHKRGPTLLIAILVVIGNGLCPTFLTYSQVCFYTLIGILLAYDALNKGSRLSRAVNITLHLIGLPISYRLQCGFSRWRVLHLRSIFPGWALRLHYLSNQVVLFQNLFCKTQYFQLSIAFGWIQGHFKQTNKKAYIYSSRLR